MFETFIPGRERFQVRLNHLAMQATPAAARRQGLGDLICNREILGGLVGANSRVQARGGGQEGG